MASVDLSVVGNGRLAALIDRTGRIVWCCWPGLDGDPLFCGLLTGEDAQGVFGVSIEGQRRASVTSPPDASAIVTRLEADSGAVLEVIDLVPAEGSGGEAAPAELIRILRPVSGRPVVRLRFDPRADWGAHRPSLEPIDGGLQLSGTAPEVKIHTDLPDPVAALQGTAFPLEAAAHVVLSASGLDAPVGVHARDALARTERWWRDWFDGLQIPDGCAAVVRPAVRGLRLCCDRRTGGIVAALTTSVPEEPGTGRTWDYRFCWLRDAFFSVRALARLGEAGAVHRFGGWLEGILAQAGDTIPQPLYALDGAARLSERVVPALAGYRGHGPVRVGNAAHTQIQHDVFGQIVLCAELAGSSSLEALRSAGEQAWALWDQPDAGVWEYRGLAHVHTSSAAFCWAALDGLARRASSAGLADEAVRWRQRADTVRDGVLQRAWSEPLQALTGAFDEDFLDASVLLLPQLGLLSWTDPRFVATVDALDRALLRDGHMMRYVVPDDFGAPSHAFTACSLWAIRALIGVGRRAEAQARFDQLLSHRSVAGLLSEDLDPRTGTGWGNYPQTYCAVGLIECALALEASAG